MVFEICSKKKIEIPKYHDSCQIYHSFAHSLNNSHIWHISYSTFWNSRFPMYISVFEIKIDKCNGEDCRTIMLCEVTIKYIILIYLPNVWFISRY